MPRYSSSASSNQPTATRPLRGFDEYESRQGKALAVTHNISDIAQYYAEVDSLSGEYPDDWDTLSYGSLWGGAEDDLPDAIPVAIRNAGDAIRAVESFQIPADIRRDANVAAKQLAYLFEQVAKIVRVRDLPAGKFDYRKGPQVGRALALGTYNRNVQRPYYRVENAPVKPPHVAIVGDASNTKIWGAGDYIPNMMRLVLGVLWAAEAAGLEVTGALTDGQIETSRGEYNAAIRAFILAEPNSTISLRHFAPAFHRDMWQMGKVVLDAADYESTRRCLEVRKGKGCKAARHDIGRTWYSSKGGHAVAWARSRGADVVIAIGQISDANDADAHISKFTSVEKAVQIVREQVSKQLLK